MDKTPTSKYDLLYFTNSTSYKKPSPSDTVKEINDMEDIKFYRKRIIHLTKLLLKNETTTTPSIEGSFQNYIHEIISHFEFIDKKDIMQQEYENLKQVKKNPNKDFNLLEKDQIILKDIKKKKINIRDFIIHNKKKSILIPPVIKKINLKTDELKTKGLPKEKSK